MADLLKLNKSINYLISEKIAVIMEGEASKRKDYLAKKVGCMFLIKD
jgi:hypothetical protein